MNKKDLIADVADAQGSTLKQAEAFVQTTLDLIAKNLSQGQPVELHGFGKFDINRKPARIGRNPSTGEKMTFAAKNSAKFKPAKALTDKLND